VYGRERADDYAARRHVVMQRANELKRALLQSTMRLAPGAAAAYNGAARKARAAQRSGSPLLRFCVALLSGALSMLIPFPSSVSLRGQLTAAADAPASVIVYAHPSQCIRLNLDESASVIMDDDKRFEAQITGLAPHAGSAEAPVCELTLQLLPNAAVAQLPAGAALTVRLAAQPRDWLAVVMEKAESDNRLREASLALRSYTKFAWQHGLALAGYVVQHPEPRHYWEMLRQLVAQDEEDSVAAD
jgi:hypothetical protein